MNRVVGSTRWSLLPLMGSLLLGLQRPAEAQVPDSLAAPSAVQGEPADTAPAVTRRMTPRGAFIRSALIPGWGHAEVGAFARGGFYFAAEAASAFMIYKTQTRIRSTDERLTARADLLASRLAAEGVTDPLEVEAALAEDETYADLTALRETRADQREDWIALGLFLMLIGGVDGYVSAQLADFPAAVVVDPAPDRGLEIGLSLPVNF